MGRTSRWRCLFALCAPLLLLPAPAYANIPAPITADALPRDLLIALVGTIVIEIVVAWLLGARRKALAAVAVMNLVTNPLLNLALLGATRLPYLGLVIGLAAANMVLGLEGVIIVVEWWILLRILQPEGWPPGRVLALSVVMNLVSWIGGNMLLARIPWLHWSPIWM